MHCSSLFLQLLAACGYQHIRMFEVSSNKGSPVVNYEGVSKNVMGVGFQEEGRWMYTGELRCVAVGVFYSVFVVNMLRAGAVVELSS